MKYISLYTITGTKVIFQDLKKYNNNNNPDS